ncbi:MAG TPA: hypothetical protein VJ180_06820 [Pyrinomonadaceae bacterium]|nr:hypothetical protein [Pyrinomonadaceae bacterium]
MFKLIFWFLFSLAPLFIPEPQIDPGKGRDNWTPRQTCLQQQQQAKKARQVIYCAE